MAMRNVSPTINNTFFANRTVERHMSTNNTIISGGLSPTKVNYVCLLIDVTGEVFRIFFL